MARTYKIYASLKENGKEFLLIDFEHPALDQSGLDKMLEVLTEYSANQGIQPNFIIHYSSIETFWTADYGIELDEMETLTTVSIFGVAHESRE